MKTGPANSFKRNFSGYVVEFGTKENYDIFDTLDLARKAAKDWTTKNPGRPCFIVMNRTRDDWRKW